jgi:hypothetical protein
MTRHTTPLPIREEDGPFSYVYLSVSAVPGMRLSNEDSAYLRLRSFPDLNAEAFLTEEWDAYCAHMETSNALALLMLTGFHGQPRWRRLSRYVDRLLVHILGVEAIFRRNLDREMMVAYQQRRTTYKSPGCYLVYRGAGELIEPMDYSSARRFGNIGFGIDAIRGEPYRAIHRRAFHGAATALSLALANTHGSPDTHLIGDIIYLKGKGDLVVYSRTLEMGMATLVTSSHLRNQDISEAQQYIPVMLNDDHVEVAISLFVQSQKKENDNLRSFIAAWSALELLINRLCRVIRADWDKLLQSETALNWDRDLRNVPPEDYRMRDRFFSVASVLDPAATSTDVDTFIRANGMRSGFYHRMEVRERDLPTNDVQTLFRKYLSLSLSAQALHDAAN